MKRNYIYQKVAIYSFIASIAILFSSCDDYLDVRPKSQIPIDTHFSNESGFKDQLVGVYTKMTDKTMYGQDMTFGLIEVLAQNYDLDAGNTQYRYAARYDYKESSTRERIDSIWLNGYNAIANINVLLDNIDKVDKTMFTENHYQLYKGEAIGLRAFLHFDLLRIFAPSYASSPNAPAIPFVTEYSPTITARSTVSAALDSIISDLNLAVDLLQSDSIKSSPTPYTHTGRRKYFNYYAAELTLARAYLYKGDKANALRHAQIIIDEGEASLVNPPFWWTHVTAKTSAIPSQNDRTYTTEQIFQLNLNKMDDFITAYFTAEANANYLSPTDLKADAIYEKSSKGYGNDYRMLYCFNTDGARVDKYLSKFWQYETSAYSKVFPLIRMTEAYYIAAEALKESDPQKSIELLDAVRSQRNLEAFPLSPDLSADEIQNEIYKEYRKEFLGEGQLFFYYKRLNLPVIDGAGVVANDNVYVLPLPDSEVEFGQ